MTLFDIFTLGVVYYVISMLIVKTPGLRTKLINLLGLSSTATPANDLNQTIKVTVTVPWLKLYALPVSNVHTLQFLPADKAKSFSDLDLKVQDDFKNMAKLGQMRGAEISHYIAGLRQLEPNEGVVYLEYTDNIPPPHVFIAPAKLVVPV